MSEIQQQSQAPAPAVVKMVQSALAGKADEIMSMLGKDETMKERFVSACVAAVTKKPEFALLPPQAHQSLLVSCMDAARDGLIPDNREAALVVFNTKVGQGQDGKDVYEPRVQYMPMVGGLKKKAYATGAIRKIDVRAVREKDVFKYSLGDDEKIIHEPAIDGYAGKVIAYYSIVTFKDGTKSREVMSAQEVDRAKAKSKSGNFGPWKDWPEEMGKKTVFKRHFKSLPQVAGMEGIAEFIQRTENDAEEQEPTGPQDVTPTQSALEDFGIDE